MEYQIILEGSVVSLAPKVNELIAQGWEPHGGVSVAVGGNGKNLTVCCAQAMIKRRTTH